MDTSMYATKSGCRQAINALQQRIGELDGQREFRFEDAYCIGGSEDPYVLPEPLALPHLRHELAASTDYPDVSAFGWDELVALASPESGPEHNCMYRFDVTRRGCQSSTLFAEEVG